MMFVSTIFIGMAIGGLGILGDAARIARQEKSPVMVKHLKEAGVICVLWLIAGIIGLGMSL